MSKKLYVGNLSWGITEDQLKEAFAKFGEIEEAIIITDRHSGRSKGFGFVTFANDAEGDAAVEGMHEQELEGRKAIVNEARPMEPRD